MNWWIIKMWADSKPTGLQLLSVLIIFIVFTPIFIIGEIQAKKEFLSLPHPQQIEQVKKACKEPATRFERRECSKLQRWLEAENVRK